MATRLCRGPCAQERPATFAFFPRDGHRLTWVCKDCRRASRQYNSGRAPDDILVHFPQIARGDVWEYGQKRLRVSHATALAGYPRVVLTPADGGTRRVLLAPKDLIENGKREVRDGS